MKLYIAIDNYRKNEDEPRYEILDISKLYKKDSFSTYDALVAFTSKYENYMDFAKALVKEGIISEDKIGSTFVAVRDTDERHIGTHNRNFTEVPKLFFKDSQKALTDFVSLEDNSKRPELNILDYLHKQSVSSTERPDLLTEEQVKRDNEKLEFLRIFSDEVYTILNEMQENMKFMNDKFYKKLQRIKAANDDLRVYINGDYYLKCKHRGEYFEYPMTTIVNGLCITEANGKFTVNKERLYRIVSIFRSFYDKKKNITKNQIDEYYAQNEDMQLTFLDDNNNFDYENMHQVPLSTVRSRKKKN